MRPVSAALTLFLCLFAFSADAACYRCVKPWWGGTNWMCGERSTGWVYCQLNYGPTGGNTCTASGESPACSGLGGGLDPEVPEARLDDTRLLLLRAEVGRETAPRLELVAAEVPVTRSGS